MSTKEQLRKARALILAKRYQEARDILYLVDEPIAHKWLAKLNEIDPPSMPDDPFDALSASATPEAPELMRKTHPVPEPVSLSSEPRTNSNYLKRQKKNDKKIPMPIAIAILVGFMALCLCSSVGFLLFYQASESLGPFLADSEHILELGSDFGRSIQFGDSVNGHLSDALPLQNYRFAANEGDRIVVTMRSADFDSLLELYDADGNFLTEDDDGGGDLDAQIIYTIPRSGDYIITATEWWSEIGIIGGSYTLSLQRQ